MMQTPFPFETALTVTILNRGVILDTRMVGSGLATVLHAQIGEVLVLLSQSTGVPDEKGDWHNEELIWDFVVLRTDSDL